MTYIAGLRCKDGVVLIGDRKIVSADGTRATYENKLTQDVPGIVVGYAGSDILSRRFRSQLVGMVGTFGAQPIGFEPFVEKIEDIVTRLNVRYRDKVTDEIEVLIAAKLAQPLVGLRHIHYTGVADEVLKYKAIGSGEPFGEVFLNHLWRDDMTMSQAAEVGHFIIRYIDRFRLDEKVGVGDKQPQIWFLPNDGMPREAEEGNLHLLDKVTNERLTKFPQNVLSLFKPA